MKNVDKDKITGLVYIGRRRLQANVKICRNWIFTCHVYNLFLWPYFGQKYIYCNNDTLCSVALDCSIKRDGVIFSYNKTKPLWHIPLLCVRWKTPDDGQRDYPKHVEFYSKNKFEKLVYLVCFIIRITLWNLTFRWPCIVINSYNKTN